MKAVVAERGQVTIPKPIRDRLGIRPKTVLEFHEDRGRVIAVKVGKQDPVGRVMGTLNIPGGTGEVMRQLRGPDADGR